MATDKQRQATWRLTLYSGCLQEVHCRFKRHLLQWGRVRLDSNTTKRLVLALKGHVVRNEGQMVVVHLDPVAHEHIPDLLWS